MGLGFVWLVALLAVPFAGFGFGFVCVGRLLGWLQLLFVRAAMSLLGCPGSAGPSSSYQIVTQSKTAEHCMAVIAL